MPDRTQDLTNHRKVATACKNYTDKKIDDLKWELGSHTLDVESDTTTAYVKTVPTGTIGCTLDKIGGMSYKCQNECVSILSDTTWDFWFRFYAKPNTTYYAKVFNNNVSSPTDAKIGLTADDNKYNYVETYYNERYSHSLTTGFSFTTGNITEGYYKLRFQFNAQKSFTGDGMIVKGSTAPTTYQPYFESIRDSAVTSVVSKDSNDTTLDTLTIPAEVQALEGYGWGVNDTCYNYIYYDITRKKWYYVQKVDRAKVSDLTNGRITSDSRFAFTIPTIVSTTTRTLLFLCGGFTCLSNQETYDSNWDMVVYNAGGTKEVIFTDKTANSDMTSFLTRNGNKYLYYELATPVETDISQYLTTNSIEVEGGGTLTANNTYEQAVPSKIDYLIEEVKA